MKKIILVLILIMSMAMFVACGGEDDADNGQDSSGSTNNTDIDVDDEEEEDLVIAGTTWKIISFKFSEEDNEVPNPETDNIYGGIVTYTFNESGSVLIDYAGSEYGSIWKQDGDTVTIDMDGFIQELDFDGNTFETETGAGYQEKYELVSEVE